MDGSVREEDDPLWSGRDGAVSGVSGALEKNHLRLCHRDEEIRVDSKRQKINSATAVQTHTSLFGLTLKKTKSLLDLVEMKLSQQTRAFPKETTQSANLDKKTIYTTQRANLDKTTIYTTSHMSERMKASNFPATLLKIGQWERTSQNEGDIVAKCYFAKRKLVWEILDDGLKSKIEFLWSDISAIHATFLDGHPGILQVELKTPPQFFHETNPQPRKHTLWQSTHDFTSCWASVLRRHYLEFPEGILEKHYEKLLHCDQRLFILSHKPFPSTNSPYFDVVQRMQDFPYDLGMHGQNFLPLYNQLSRDWCPTQYPNIGNPRTIMDAQENGVFELVGPSMNVTCPTQFLKPTAGVTGVTSPSSATNLAPISGNSAMNRAIHEPTPIWNQGKQHQMSAHDALAPGAQEFLSGGSYTTLIPNFLSRRISANNLVSCTTGIGAYRSRNWEVQDIAEHLLGDPHAADCSDEQRLMAKVNSMEFLLNAATQLDSQLDNLNVIHEGEHTTDGKDSPNILHDIKQLEFDEDESPVKVLLMDFPRVASNPLPI